MVHNISWNAAVDYVFMALDVTSGLLVFYNAETTLKQFNTKTLKFCPPSRSSSRYFFSLSQIF